MVLGHYIGIHFDSQSRLVRNLDIAVDGAERLGEQELADRRVGHRVFQQFGVRKGRNQVQAGRQQDSRLEGMWNQVNICIVRDVADLPGLGEAASARDVRLHDVDRTFLDQFPESPPAAFGFSGGNIDRNRRRQAFVPFIIVRGKRFFHPAQAVFLEASRHPNRLLNAVGLSDVEHQVGLAGAGTRRGNKFDVTAFILSERPPSEFHGGETLLDEAASHLFRLGGRFRHQYTGVSSGFIPVTSAEQFVTGLPAALPKISQRAMSTPLIVWMTTACRPKYIVLRYICSQSCSISKGSWPNRISRRPLAIACEVGASITARPTSGEVSTSPQPYSPSSVSIRIRR